MKKYNLNINPSYMIVLKFHMLLLYIYHQTVSKQCFLVGESRYQSYAFLAKITFFQKETHFNFTVWPFKWKIMIGGALYFDTRYVIVIIIVGMSLEQFAGEVIT